MQKGMTVKANEVKVGGTYYVQQYVNCDVRVVAVQVVSEHQDGGWVATNMTTGRSLRIKSARRLYATQSDCEQARQQRLQTN